MCVDSTHSGDWDAERHAAPSSWSHLNAHVSGAPLVTAASCPLMMPLLVDAYASILATDLLDCRRSMMPRFSSTPRKVRTLRNHRRCCCSLRAMATTSSPSESAPFFAALAWQHRHRPCHPLHRWCLLPNRANAKSDRVRMVQYLCSTTEAKYRHCVAASNCAPSLNAAQFLGSLFPSTHRTQMGYAGNIDHVV